MTIAAPPPGASGQTPPVAAEGLKLRVEPSGIGGWLALPALGFIIGIPKTTLEMSRDLQPIIQPATIDALLGPDVPVGMKLYMLAALGGSVVLYVALIVAAVLFFRKKRSAPGFIINFQFVSVGFLALIAFWGMSIPELGEEPYAQIGTTVAMAISAAIWIPYFMHSKRVKNTFVN